MLILTGIILIGAIHNNVKKEMNYLRWWGYLSQQYIRLRGYPSTKLWSVILRWCLEPRTFLQNRSFEHLLYIRHTPSTNCCQLSWKKHICIYKWKWHTLLHIKKNERNISPHAMRRKESPGPRIADSAIYLRTLVWYRPFQTGITTWSSTPVLESSLI